MTAFPDFDIPGYSLEKRLGAGGMAQVYLALQHSLNRKVALKIMTLAEPELRERFVQEGRMVARLSHHHIITVYDVGEFPGGAYMAMEYADGGALDQRIKKKLTVEQSLAIFRQIASALDHAHQRGLVHRDIKPANILFMETGEVRVADFGIAKDNQQDHHLTQTGSVMGTPIYMSPEQALGDRATSRSDLYSLGVMLYEMLTGNRPYKAQTSQALLVMHLRDPIPRLPDSLAVFQGIIDRLMAKQPEQRFASAAEVLAALEEIPPVPLGLAAAEASAGDGEWRVSVEPDPEQRPGYAVLVIEGLALPPHEVQCCIRRSGFGNDDLGPEGWRNGEHWFEPHRIDLLPNRESRLMVGPEIAQYLENGNYQLSLKAPGFSKSQERVMRWRDIPQTAPTGKRRRGGMASMAVSSAGPVPSSPEAILAPASVEAPTTAGSAPPLPTVIEPAQVSQPTPPLPTVAKPTLQPEAARPDPVARSVPSAPLPPPAGENERVAVAPPARTVGLILAAVGALMVLGAGGYGWWWWQGRESVRSPATPTRVDQSAEKPAEKPTPPATVESAVFTAQEARRKLQEGLTPEQMYSLGQRFQTQPGGLDGALLLYSQAAEQGQAGAALKLGEMYDPASSVPTPLQRRRAAKAYEWYQRAAAGGVPEAAQRLSGLRAWAEQEAARGDADAQALLQDWPR